MIYGYNALPFSLISLEQLSYRQAVLGSLVEYLLCCISNSSSWFKSVNICALTCVMEENADRCSTQYRSIVDLLSPHAGPAALHMESKIAALKCIDALCQKGGSKTKDLHGIIFNTVLPNVFGRTNKSVNNKDQNIVFARSLSILTSIAKDSKELHVSHLPSLLRSVQCALCEGLTGESLKVHDADKCSEQVRLQAVTYLQTVVSITPSESQQHVFLFLPDTEGGSPTPFDPTLLTVLLYDPVDGIRNNAAITLNTFLDTIPFSKWIVDKVKRRGSKSVSFKPHSLRIVDMVGEVHSAIIIALGKEAHEEVICSLPCPLYLSLSSPFSPSPSSPTFLRCSR
jgi:hypothetical protein